MKKNILQSLSLFFMKIECQFIVTLECRKLRSRFSVKIKNCIFKKVLKAIKFIFIAVSFFVKNGFRTEKKRKEGVIWMQRYISIFCSSNQDNGKMLFIRIRKSQVGKVQMLYKCKSKITSISHAAKNHNLIFVS